MHNKFKETFLEEKQFEQAVASQWGYKISPGFDFKPKQAPDQSPPVIANIQLIRMNGPSIKSERIKQVED